MSHGNTFAIVKVRWETMNQAIVMMVMIMIIMMVIIYTTTMTILAGLDEGCRF